MKLTQFLPEVTDRFRLVGKSLPAYADELYKSGDFRDFYTRLAYDVFRAVYPASERCDFYDRVAQAVPDYTVAHMTTLLVKAVRIVLDENTRYDSVTGERVAP